MPLSSSRMLGGLGFLFIAAAAHAQDDPAKVTTPPPTQEPAAPQEEETTKVRLNTFTLGYSTWDTRGLDRRLRQYATPPSGLFVSELSLLSPWAPKNPFGRFIWRGDPWQDHVALGTLLFNGGHSMIRGSLSRFDYSLPIAEPVEGSHREMAKVVAETRLGPNAGAFYSYRKDEHEARFVAPLDSTKFVAETNSVGIAGKALGGQAALTLVDFHFDDRTSSQPNSEWKTANASYAADLSPAFTVEGSAGVTQIAQTGRPNSNVRTATAGAIWNLAESTSLQFNFTDDEFDLRTVRNSYSQQRLTTSARLNHRWPNGSLQLGFRHREDERVRQDQAFVDVPKWNRYEARVYNRLGRTLRLTLRGVLEDLTDQAAMETLDARNLFWTNRSYLQAKLDGGNWRSSGYAAYSLRYRKNEDRGLDVAWHNFSVGGSQSLRPDLLGYAEVSYDRFAVKSPADSLGENLDFYFPDNISVAVGVDWSRSEQDFFGGSLNFSQARDTRSAQATFEYRRQLSSTDALDLVLSPWRFDDRSLGVTGYNAVLFQIRYQVRF